MKIFKQSLNYKYIMSNGADYIFNASEKNLEEDHIHLMCYFHVKKAIKRNFAEKKVSKEDREKILHCINDLHSMIDERHFAHYYKLFKERYASYPGFLTYLDKEWVYSKTSKWRYFDCLVFN